MANSNITSQLRNRIASNNPIETERPVSDIPDRAGQDIQDSVTAAPADFFNQLLAVDGLAPHSQERPADDVKPYEKFTLYASDHKDPEPTKQKAERRVDIAPAMNYHSEIAHGSERASKKENRELQFQIQEIVAELQRLVDSSNKIIQMEFGTVSVSSAPTTVGKYHTNFFSWMLTVIRTARQKVEDSGAWLAVAKGKGHKRGYKQSSKSLGTSFTQSNERQVATQTG